MTLERPSQDKRPVDVGIEKTSGINLEALSKERLDKAIAVANTIFPNIVVGTNFKPEVSFPASLEPEKYKAEIEAAGIRKLDYGIAVDKHDATKIVGITGLYENIGEPADVGWLGYYGVSPESRGKGYGRYILEDTIAKAKARGYNTLRLYTTTTPDEAVAQKLYDESGFKVVKEESIPGSEYRTLYREKDLSDIGGAIQFLDASRKDTNARLAQQNLELTRDNHTLTLKNIATGKAQQSFEIETLEIETLKNPEHERFNGAYDFLAETFGSKELDTKASVADQMRGLRYGHPNGTEARAVIFTLSKDVESKNQNGKSEIRKEVVGVLDGGLINLQDEQGKFTGECIFMVFYIGSKTGEDKRNNYRQIGFGRELMISGYEYAKSEARARGMKLVGAAGECTYPSRTFWERMGWKRAYMQKEGDISKNWKEASYVQPPLNFDLDTGAVEEGAGDAPEHFMINLFRKDASQSPQVGKQLTAIVNGFYRTDNYIPPASFGLSLDEKTKELKPIDPSTDQEALTKAIGAYERHLEAIDPHLQNFSEQFNGMRVRFLTADEIKSEKLAVENYITADAEAKIFASASALH